jgi:DNA polymerase-3 subunit epsilon
MQVRKPAKNKVDFVAIDFETASPVRNSVCAVGIAEVLGGRIAKVSSWLVRPPILEFSPFNVAIHGITERHVRDEPQFNELWPKLWKIFRGKPVIAHNASFDMSIIRYVFDFYRQPYPKLDYFCTVAMARRAWPGLPNYQLPTVSTFLDIPLVHHDPAEDAAAAAQIALYALAHLGCRDLYDFSEQMRMRAGRLYPGGYVACSRL